MQNFFTKLSRLNKHILPEEGPWAALLLIPVTIISGAYWTSIPYYGVIAILWLFQRKTPIPWESGITIMFITLIWYLYCFKNRLFILDLHYKNYRLFYSSVFLETSYTIPSTTLDRYIFCDSSRNYLGDKCIQ